MNHAIRETAVADDRLPKAETGLSQRPSILLNVALLAFTILLGCIAVELVLRVIFAHSLDFSMEMWKYAVQLKRPVANPHHRSISCRCRCEAQERTGTQKSLPQGKLKCPAGRITEVGCRH